MPKTNKEIIEEFRKKWGQFYYSDTAGMDWIKPNGFCIASGNIEQDLLQALSDQKKEMRKMIDGMKKEIGHILKCNMCSPKCGYNKAIQDIDDILKELDL